MKQRYRFLLLLIGFLPTLSTYSYDFEVDGICYTVTSFEDFIVTVDGFKSTLSGIVEIPNTVTFNNRVFSVTSITSAKGATIESVNIPSKVTTIERAAFSGTKIEHIYIPDNVTSLGEESFKDCTNLKSIRIPSTVSTLREALFSGCTNLVEVDWHPDKNGVLFGNVFSACKSLRTVRIPSGITLRGSEDPYSRMKEIVFKGCTSLDSLIIEDGEGSMLIKSSGRDYNYDSYGEFLGSNIKYVYLGRPISIDVSPNGTQAPRLECVEHLEIGDNVDELQFWLPSPTNYSSSKQLKTLVVGKSLKKIGDFAHIPVIGGNTTLEYIKIKRSTPPEAVGFSNYNYINTILYVPKGAKANYESADIWKNFFNIIEYSDDGTEVETKKCAKPTINYQNGKLIFDCATEGSTCQSTIADSDISSYSVNEVQLGVTYNIRVYATKPGYENSEVATATLCWIDQLPDMKGIAEDEDIVTEVKATPVLIQSEDGTIYVKGADDGTNVLVYDVNGRLLGSTFSNNGHANIRTNLHSGSTAIVKIEDRSIKVLIK